MDEQLLIDGCKRGEASARKELYELYAPAMMSVCARYVHDRETARDLLQDGFIKVFTKIQTYSATGPFGAWPLWRLATKGICDDGTRISP